jgi:hypothetical protein
MTGSFEEKRLQARGVAWGPYQREGDPARRVSSTPCGAADHGAIWVAPHSGFLI